MPEEPQARANRAGLAGPAAGLLAVVLAAQVAITAAFDLPRLPDPIAGAIAALGRVDGEVLYFGDSSLRYSTERVPPERSTPALLAGRLGAPVVPVDGPAYHAGVFLDCARYLDRTGLLPDVVVVAVNPRSFAPSWRLNPGYGFEDLRLALRHRGTPLQPFVRALRVFAVGPPLGVAPPLLPGEELGSHVPASMSTRTSLEEQYAIRLTPDNPRLRELGALAELLGRSRTRALFYATPVDWEVGLNQGVPLRAHLAESMSTVGERVAASGATWLDLSTRLPRERFAWSSSPNEHLDDAGREWLADRIADALETLVLESDQGRRELEGGGAAQRRAQRALGAGVGGGRVLHELRGRHLRPHHVRVQLGGSRTRTSLWGPARCRAGRCRWTSRSRRSRRRSGLPRAAAAPVGEGLPGLSARRLPARSGGQRSASPSRRR